MLVKQHLMRNKPYREWLERYDFKQYDDDYFSVLSIHLNFFSQFFDRLRTGAILEPKWITNKINWYEFFFCFPLFKVNFSC